MKKNAKELSDNLCKKLRNRNYRVSQKTRPKVMTCNETGQLFMWEVICIKVPLVEYQESNWDKDHEKMSEGVSQ